ncbi:hypothetical protein CF335_g8693 [Tilletia laevis]|nr:hypothetical protein CF335_g8693 [Tilletia laevis]
MLCQHFLLAIAISKTAFEMVTQTAFHKRGTRHDAERPTPIAERPTATSPPLSLLSSSTSSTDYSPQRRQDHSSSLLPSLVLALVPGSSLLAARSRSRSSPARPCSRLVLALSLVPCSRLFCSLSTRLFCSLSLDPSLSLDSSLSLALSRLGLALVFGLLFVFQRTAVYVDNESDALLPAEVLIILEEARTGLRPFRTFIEDTERDIMVIPSHLVVLQELIDAFASLVSVLPAREYDSTMRQMIFLREQLDTLEHSMPQRPTEPLWQRTMSGRLRVYIDSDTLCELVEKEFTDDVIAIMLGTSLRTVERRRAELGLRKRGGPAVSDDELYAVRMITLLERSAYDTPLTDLSLSFYAAITDTGHPLHVRLGL